MEPLLAAQDKTDAKMEAPQERIEDRQERIEARLEIIEAAIQAMRSDKQAIQNQMEDVLSCLQHNKQKVYPELIEITEKMQLELDAAELSIDRCMRKLQEEVRSVKSGLLTEIMTVHSETQATRKEALANIEAARREFQTQLEDVKTRAEDRAARAVNQLKFDRTASWPVFRRQFGRVAEQNCWTCEEKSKCLITGFQGRASDVLLGIPKGATCEKTLRTLEDRFGDQQFAFACRAQLKARKQKVGESLQLVCHACPTLPEHHVATEPGRGFVIGIEDLDIKLRLLLAEEKTLREALQQALQLRAVLLDTRSQRNYNGIFRWSVGKAQDPLPITILLAWKIFLDTCGFLLVGRTLDSLTWQNR
jgi:hypothetical protein